MCACEICDRPDCEGVGEDEGVAINSTSIGKIERNVPAPAGGCADSPGRTQTIGPKAEAQARSSDGDLTGERRQSPNLYAEDLHSSTAPCQMNIPPTKAYCLSSSLHRRHSSTLTFLVCSLFTVPARHAARHSARHSARQRLPLIRHLIRQRKPPAQHCGGRLRCVVLLYILRYARGRNLRLQICHFLAVSLLSLSLITTNSLSNNSHLLVHLCLHSFRHSLLLLSTHSDILSISHLHSLRHSFLHLP